MHNLVIKSCQGGIQKVCSLRRGREWGGVVGSLKSEQKRAGGGGSSMCVRWFFKKKY